MYIVLLTLLSWPTIDSNEGGHNLPGHNPPRSKSPYTVDKTDICRRVYINLQTVTIIAIDLSNVSADDCT